MFAAAAALWVLAGQPNDPGIFLQFDLPNVDAGQKNRVHETVPISHGSIIQISHHATLIKDYDPATQQMVKRTIALVEMMSYGGPMGDLSSGHTFFHGAFLRKYGLLRKGISFDFSPTRPGVYEVTAEWTLLDSGRRVVSKPAILTVWPAK